MSAAEGTHARSEQDQFQRLFEQAPALIALLNGRDHIFTFANPLYRALFSGRDIVGKPIREALPELAGQGFYEILDEVHRTGESYVGEAIPARIDRGNSGRLDQAFFHITFQATRDPSGLVDGILILAVEVTDQIQARDELKRSKERYEALARTQTQFVWGTGPSGQVEDMPEWRAFTGQTLDEVEGMGWANAVHPADRAAALAAWTSAVQSKGLYEVEYRVVHRDGGYRWLHVRGLPVLEPDGAIREWVGVANDVTEQKEAQAALLEANEELSTQREELHAQQEELSSLYEQLRHRHEQVQSERDRLFELSLDLIATADATGYLTDVNPAWTKTLGWTTEELQARPFLEFIVPEDRQRSEDEVRKLLEEGLPTLQFQNRFLTKGGKVRTLDWRGYADQGVIYAIARDVTEQRESEAKLVEANEQLTALAEELQSQTEALQSQAQEMAVQREALEDAHRETISQKELIERIVQSAPVGISYMNRDLIYEWVNPVQARLWGLPAENVVGRSVVEVFGLDADSEVIRLLRGVLESGEPYFATDFSFTYLVNGKPRTTLWDFSYQPVHGHNQDIVGVLVSATEVTERKRAEAVLKESEERYRSLFEASRDALVTATLDRGIIDVNPAFVRMFGYTLDEVVGRDSAFLYPSPQAYVAVGKRVAADPNRTDPVVFETELKRKDGTLIPIELSSYLLRDVEGRPSRLVGVLRDLTTQRQNERQREAHSRELASQKAFAESLIQNIATGVAYLDRDLVFRVANSVYADFVKVPAEELVGRHLFDALPSDRSQIEPILLKVLETGEPFYAREFPFVYHTPDGVERTTYWDFVYYPVRATEDEPVQGIFALADEISDRIEQQREQRQLREEQERLQKERLEALEQSDKLKDQFLSILSHELRTPINAIMGFGSVLDDEVVGPLSPEQHAYTAKILSSADALLTLIEDLLIVSRVQAGKFSISPQRTRFEDMVVDALETQGPAAEKKAISLVNHVPKDLPALVADPMRVVQVLNNLLSNAIKFTPNCGQVVVRASAEGRCLRCEVSDTGIGIAAEDQPKLFQRFSQLDMSNTRAAGGAGLGLSIVKAIVNAHGGDVGIESERGNGSTFWFTLPLGIDDAP